MSGAAAVRGSAGVIGVARRHHQLVTVAPTAGGADPARVARMRALPAAEGGGGDRAAAPRVVLDPGDGRGAGVGVG